MPSPPLNRRSILRQTGRLAVGSAALSIGFQATAEPTPLTPRQSLGPFFPDQLPLDTDNDLLFISGRPGRAIGQPTDIFGQVRLPDGTALPGAVIEIWQCDAFGRYIHSRDAGRGRRDKNFQGYGRAITDKDGRYRFRTIKPVAYPGRTPHIHFLVRQDNADLLVTQMYVEGEALNRRDGLLNRVSDPLLRRALIVPLTASPELGENALSGRFDITVAA